MAALLAGIVCLVLAFLLPVPYVLYVVLLIAGIVLLYMDCTCYLLVVAHDPSLDEGRYA